jgi:uncharacterized protein YjbJ (UPF0337 family)
MDREHAKDVPDKIKGTIKDTAGKAAGDQTEVKFDNTVYEE